MTFQYCIKHKLIKNNKTKSSKKAMEYALYRYEFEVIEKKDSSINLFPELSESFNPRQAFEKRANCSTIC